MKNLILPILAFVLTISFQNNFAQDEGSHTKIANQLTELINAGDYPGVENLFNKEMSQAQPLEKATAFFEGMAGKFGRIQSLDAPRRNGSWTVFPTHFERGMMDLSLALDGEYKISGLLFKPRAAPSDPAPNTNLDMGSYTKVANRLVELIDAADYPGVESLFNKEMRGAMPLERTTQFFTELNAQVCKIQKLGEPKRKADEIVFPAHCEGGNLDMSLALDDEGRIAGLIFKPGTASPEVAPRKQITELSLPFKGRWLVFWGGDTRELNHHHDVRAQEFAFDIVGVDEKGETHRGDGTKNEDYFCFGREIYVPADGVVVEAIDGVRDNKPGSMNSYCLVGNCVVIQHRTNEFSVLAHFQRGSVAVKAGDRVARGQLLGKCGNSGNSSEPHLHFHLQDSAIFQDAIGIKCAFDKVPLTGGATKLNYSPAKDEIINAQ